jgi:deoxyribodipyrimidine photo-lyase
MNVFLFHRDFRLQDNLALDALSQFKEPIVCIFIFTPTQIQPKENPFYSSRSFQFMCESLEDLRQDLKDRGSDLYFFYGDTLSVLKTLPIQRLGFNLDYTPYSRRRDEEILEYCLEKKIQCITAEDYLLSPMGTFLKPDNTPYLVYTPFKNNALTYEVAKPTILRIEFGTLSYYKEYTPVYSSQPQIKGGRKEALKRLEFKYQHDKFEPTTELSAYLKYGCLSIREAYWANSNALYHQQLLWREFFYYIACYFPKVLDTRSNFKASFVWNNSKPDFERWCKGETGFPIVDAAMRQLNQTGYMHNRGRLITANFLTRLLAIDWRWGEMYYAKQLIDYDPCVNNGNWQWVAGTGVDRAPYSQRIFNPWIQSAKFDADAVYIKQWIPALKDVPAKHLHQWDKYFNQYPIHPKPMIDYAEARTQRLKNYKE